MSDVTGGLDGYLDFINEAADQHRKPWTKYSSSDPKTEVP